MADEMWFNYNTEISMFNKGGYVAYVALIIILLRIAKKCKPAWKGGSCGRISLKGDQCHLHLKRLPALASVAS